METLKRHKLRFLVTLFLLIFYTVASNLLFDDGYTPTINILIWFLGTIILTYVLGIVWRYKLVLMTDSNNQLNHRVDALQQAEKRKRQTVDDLFDSLSDQDLERLKQRLEDTYQHEAEVYRQRMLDDDGELVYRRDVD